MRRTVRIYMKSGHVIKFKVKSFTADLDDSGLITDLHWTGANRIVSFSVINDIEAVKYNA